MFIRASGIIFHVLLLAGLVGLPGCSRQPEGGDGNSASVPPTGTTERASADWSDSAPAQVPRELPPIRIMPPQLDWGTVPPNQAV